jgi:hypothetical protein
MDGANTRTAYGLHNVRKQWSAQHWHKRLEAILVRSMKAALPAVALAKAGALTGN